MQKVTKTIDQHGDTYYRNEKGQWHNETGPAIIYADGSMSYWINDKRHRIDGPAIIRTDGTMQYCINGKLHRTDGPAIIWSDGTVQYYINNRHIKSLKEFQQLTKMSSEDMTAMILKYGHDGFTKE